MARPNAPSGPSHFPLLSIPNYNPASPRTRSASLSIARSPLPSPSAQASVSGQFILPTHARNLSIPLERISDSSFDTLNHPISTATAKPASMAAAKSITPKSAGLQEQEEMDDVERDIEALDTALLGQGASGREGELKGPFQPPQAAELYGIVLSVAAVTLLAVVACCTTIYDWIL